jgi:hypothetical protein
VLTFLPPKLLQDAVRIMADELQATKQQLEDVRKEKENDAVIAADQMVSQRSNRTRHASMSWW